MRPGTVSQVAAQAAVVSSVVITAAKKAARFVLIVSFSGLWTERKHWRLLLYVIRYGVLVFAFGFIPEESSSSVTGNHTTGTK